MIRKFLALAILLLPLSCSYQPAMAQTCPTRPAGDNSNACASTAFVQGALPVVPSPANPTASVGNTVVNGTATTYMRSDAAPPLGAGVAAANVGTLGGVLGGTLPNPSMAAGAAATNVGTLGGDLSGTLPNPTVAKVQGLAYKSAATYTNGQVPTWSSLNSRFEPQTPTGSIAHLVYDVTAYNLVGDAVVVTNAACTSSSTTVTSATANFNSSTDVGKAISIEGCGAAGATLNTTISSVTNSTTVVVGAAAGTTATGAQLTFGTDNTTALAALITTVNAAHGGTILFPAGWYLFTGTINLSQTFNITLTGPVLANGGNSVSVPPARLLYTATGTGNAINCNDSISCTIQSLWLSYMSASYTGTYFVSNNTGTRDSTYTHLVHNNFWTGLSTRNTANWVDIDKSVITTIQDNVFWGAHNAIIGAHSGSYSNSVQIVGNTFGGGGSTYIIGGGQAWSLIANTFEGLLGGTGSIFICTSTNGQSGMVWQGNWFGDITTTGGTLITVYGVAFSFIGNFVVGIGGLDAISLNSVTGFQITGNEFYTFANVINYVTATVNGGLLSGNAYHAVTNFEANTANKGANVVNTGNASF